MRLNRSAYYFGLLSIAGIGALLALTVLTQSGHVRVDTFMYAASAILALMVVGGVVIAVSVFGNGPPPGLSSESEGDLSDN